MSAVETPAKSDARKRARAEQAKDSAAINAAASQRAATAARKRDEREAAKREAAERKSRLAQAAEKVRGYVAAMGDAAETIRLSTLQCGMVAVEYAEDIVAVEKVQLFQWLASVARFSESNARNAINAAVILETLPDEERKIAATYELAAIVALSPVKSGKGRDASPDVERRAAIVRAAGPRASQEKVQQERAKVGTFGRVSPQKSERVQIVEFLDSNRADILAEAGKYKVDLPAAVALMRFGADLAMAHKRQPVGKSLDSLRKSIIRARKREQAK